MPRQQKLVVVTHIEHGAWILNFDKGYTCRHNNGHIGKT